MSSLTDKLYRRGMSEACADLARRMEHTARKLRRMTEDPDADRHATELAGAAKQVDEWARELGVPAEPAE